MLALITGITGQDGSYLAELLVEKGYTVYGIIRRCSSISTSRIDHLLATGKVQLRYGDMSDAGSIVLMLQEIVSNHPTINRLEIYNLAAMSHVKASFETPEYTADINGLGTLRMLEAIRQVGIGSKVRFYQASTSELYGKVQETPQTETTPFYPRSPYGVSKLCAFWFVKNYREAYDMFACNGILFNHESPRRCPTFVTRKITLGLKKILSGQEDQLVLGNLDAKRDWGHSRDYVEGMWRMLQADEPDDFVMSTNEYHTVREFVVLAFAQRGFRIEWQGHGLEEVGIDTLTGKTMITVSEKFFRPTEVDELLGDSSKARQILGWKPTIRFEELVKEMVDSDCPV